MINDNSPASGPFTFHTSAPCSMCKSPAYTSEKRGGKLVYFCRQHMPETVKRFQRWAFGAMLRGSETRRRRREAKAAAELAAKKKVEGAIPVALDVADGYNGERF